MKEQILKGFVVIDPHDMDGEVFLVKNDQKETSSERELGSLVSNALLALGVEDMATEDDFENQNINQKFIADNIQLQVFASSKRTSLDDIKEKVILDSMGLLELQEDWYGYSTWTVMGFNVETFTLGGHDILEIIKSLKDKFIYMVIKQINL
ncbi:hypothetical protein [Vagococcus salmoninarum]|uniref:hypothetical protein n=1 Tax=Vagococcus salmoninarum TaxID=2739 RepID=UPI0018830DBD|nr:hypothetical protein [Vagococcus salmoninarum]MBE9390144.1 hypothetical protein [Vagococcus salmoninarum]